MRRARTALVAALLFGGVVTGGRAQSLDLKLESREVYAGLPFVLSLQAQGFDEEPAPEPPELKIDRCSVTFLGVSPNVSEGVQIINGRRSEWRQVTFVYRYRVEAPTKGEYTVPAITLTQGNKSASSRPGTFRVEEITPTTDMKVRLDLPSRPVWIGETFEVAIEWLLRRDVGDHSFVVPLFDLDFVQVQPAPVDTRNALTFPAGARTVDLPYTQDSTTVDGVRYNRLRFPALVTVNRAGPIDLDPIKVAASLEMGTGRDRFGFPVPRYELHKAEDQRRRLSVRPLPQQGRPDSFVNAIGSRYSFSVQADRTVVQVGDPVELDILVRGDGPLEGLSLPRLRGSGGLPPELFSVPDQAPVGELDPENNGKRFRVTVRIRSAEAREIPSLEFSYFDPAAGDYRTVHSQPIALSVAGSAMVGAGDVMAADTASPAESGPEPGPASAAPTGFATLIGADLSLSDPGVTLRRAWSARGVAPLVAALYLLPGLAFGYRIWQVRTRGRRGREQEMRDALREVEAALDQGDAPAREAAPRILNALRALARLTAREDALHGPALAEIETRAFDPRAAEAPLDPGAVREVRELARGWVADARARSRSNGAALALLLALPTLVLGTTGARAADGGPSLERAREIYRAALEEPDRVRRTRLFAQSELLLRELAADHGASPELLVDWGNAALGAQEIGRAALAYRRALLLDPDDERARKNLAWLRDRAPQWLPRPPKPGAIDSLFFWHHALSVSQRFLLGAAAFAAGALLLAPWSRRRAKLLRRLAVPALAIWVATTTSAFLAPDPHREGVILTDGVVLRSADSLGAPPSLANPLPAGTEIRVLESRGSWTRIRLADGTLGWLGAGTLETLAP